MHNKDLLLKGLLYRSIHRGCKETDILVGKYAQEYLSKMDDNNLKLFGKFIIEDDAEIYDWILNKTPCPDYYKDLILDIREFHDLNSF